MFIEKQNDAKDLDESQTLFVKNNFQPADHRRAVGTGVRCYRDSDFVVRVGSHRECLENAGFIVSAPSGIEFRLKDRTVDADVLGTESFCERPAGEMQTDHVSLRSQEIRRTVKERALGRFFGNGIN